MAAIAFKEILKLVLEKDHMLIVPDTPLTEGQWHPRDNTQVKKQGRSDVKGGSPVSPDELLFRERLEATSCHGSLAPGERG